MEAAMSPQLDVNPFVSGATPQQVATILGGMRNVAETDGALSEADTRALAAASLYMFGEKQPLDVGSVKPVAPAALAAALSDPALREDALKFATVMAFIDGTLDKAKIAKVIDYANALGLHERYVDEIAEAAHGHVKEALADMTRANMVSITGKAWTDADATAWLMPYDKAPDPALTARCKALGNLPKDSFGYAFYNHYTSNKYDFPGEAKGLNAAFALPHDTVHVASGYGTTPRGELLASTFTAAMHPHFPMAGHILPVIFSFQLNVQINAVAKDAKGALDPEEFWHAYAGGKTATIDTFAPGWDFWKYVETPLRELRRKWSIPQDGLDRRN
jgi:tellurite resistance protein